MTNAPLVMDSVQKSRIDTLVEQMHAAIREYGQPGKIPFPEYNENDTIYYWLLKDGSGRISIELEPPGQVDWPVFYFYNNHLIKVRYRYSSNVAGSQKAYESTTYLEQGRIVYCEERGRDLAEGEYPGSIRQLIPAPSKRSPEEIEADYLETWKKILPLVKLKDPRANSIIE